MSLRMNRSFLLCLALSASSAGGAMAATHTLYVDHESSGGDGSSWTAAFANLQDALIEADSLVSGTTDTVAILVADGVYRPDIGGGMTADDRSAALWLPDRVIVYGGHAGISNTAAPRDVDLYPTIITGDLGIPGDTSDNSYHLFMADGIGASGLDGLTLRDALADGGGTDGVGAGVCLLDAEVSLNACVLRDLGAGEGAGVYAGPGSMLSIAACRFENNLASGGAGIRATQVDLHVADSTFIQNVGLGGGAMKLELVDALIQTSSLELNEAFTGGAMLIALGTVAFESCDFSTNRADFGGAMYLDNITLVSAKKCRLIRNTADDGGAVYLKNCGDSPNGLVAVSTLFDRNAADQNGGAVHSDGPVFLHNSVLDTNTALNHGGGLYLHQTADAELINDTFSANDALVGDAIYFASSGTMEVFNSILWGAAAGPIVDLGLGTVTVGYTNIRGGWAGAGGANINASPKFVNAGTGDFRLRSTSPCIDVGANGRIPLDTLDVDDDGNFGERLPRDYRNKARKRDGNLDGVNRVDMGACEYIP